jgi:NADH-quinone oxidoreductase subunit F
MDIRVHGPEANMAERGAIDSVLDDAQPQRDLLLPVLHAVQARFGWLPPGALNYMSQRMGVPPAEVFGVATFYHLFSLTPRAANVIHICDDLACRLQGAEQICAEAEAKLGHPGGDWTSERTSCLGQCERAPAALVIQAGARPKSFVAAGGGRPSPVSEGSLLKRIGRVDPESLDAYRQSGGYHALERAIALGPQAVIEELTASNLTGRGGAAFPTGRKWDAVAKAPARPHYVVCNADESEPGTFKDRTVMEGDPFAVIEGMTIAAFATGSEYGYLYIRGEYPLAAQRVENAIKAAREQNLLGKNIFNAGFSFDIDLRRGAGAYICGEETALFNSIEGKRGEPRNKPPFPVNVGLFGKPTVINNVETLVNVPLIVLRGGARFAPTRLFCVSGHVARPGLYELTSGRNLRELIDMAGGVPGGKKIQAVLLGGAAGTFVGPDNLDVPLTPEGTRAIGASLGSGVVMVFDESVNMAGVMSRIAAFFRDESCGQCVPCRVGTVRQEELLGRLKSGRTIGSKTDELALLKEIGQAMRDASICGLGQTASSAIESAFANLKPKL